MGVFSSSTDPAISRPATPTGSTPPAAHEQVRRSRMKRICQSEFHAASSLDLGSIIASRKACARRTGRGYRSWR